MAFDKERVPPSFNRFLKLYGGEVSNLVSNKYRCLMVLAGKNPALQGLLAAKAVMYYTRKRRGVEKKVFNGLYIYHDEFEDAVSMKESFERAISSKYVNFQYDVYEKSEKYMGTTFSFLVMDLTKDLKPNDVGRLVGIVEGGGLIVLITPPWSEWDEFNTIFKRSLTVPQFPEPRHVFIKWFKQKLMEHSGIGIYDVDSSTVIKKFEAARKRASDRKKVVVPQSVIFARSLYKLALTADQINVIKLLEAMYERVSAGKKRVVVITADRGRGKSCAVGIGVVGLIDKLKDVKPKTRVLVTAPSSGNVQSLMSLAMKALEMLSYEYDVYKRENNVIEIRSERFSIEYWEPASIPKIRGDIVVVDEAAGIPVPMLHKIWRSHKRLIFLTTIHGYEGAGRGFSIRFLQAIRSDKNTELIEYEMEEPIRYSVDDPIEEWQFKALLLDAEPAQLEEEDLKAIEGRDLVYVKYDPAQLFSEEGEEELRQLFGIYVLAHYRNEPDDLGMLADAPHHLIRAVKTKTGRIVCAIQVALEGGIDEDLASELFRGSRIPGNIIPDRFLKHSRLRGFSKTRGWRIVRIATHPSVQGRGIGSWALSKLAEEALSEDLDWIAASFGVNEDLLRFWLKNGFLPVHISPNRNPVSGEYTLIVISPLKEESKKYVERANMEFRVKLINSLAINYRDLELEVAHSILSHGRPLLEDSSKKLLTPVQLDRLWIYCVGPMTFEAAADLMHRIAKLHWILPANSRPQMSKDEEYLLIGKALEGRSWEELGKELRVPVKDLHKYAHKIACKYFEYLTSRKPEEHAPGVDDLDYEFTIYL